MIEVALFTSASFAGSITSLGNGKFQVILTNVQPFVRPWWHRDRPGTPLLHLDFAFSDPTNQSMFVDNIIAHSSGPYFTFDVDIQGWFEEPEEVWGISFETNGPFDGGALELGESGYYYDLPSYEHQYHSAWNAQPGVYSSISMDIMFQNTSIYPTGITFRIDDGSQAAMYGAGMHPMVPEPTTLLLLGLGTLVLLRKPKP